MSLESELYVVIWGLKERIRDLEARLAACNGILAKNAEELPAFVEKMTRRKK